MIKITVLIVFVYASNAIGSGSQKIIDPVIVGSKHEAIKLILDGKIWQQHTAVINYFEKAELWHISVNGMYKEILNYDFFENMPNSKYKDSAQSEGVRDEFKEYKL